MCESTSVESYKRGFVKKKELLKLYAMTIGSQWEKGVVCIFKFNRFLHFKELLDVKE